MSNSLLIVEDDLDQLAMLQRWFIKTGYQVTGVHHPRMALAAASLHPFQVAIVNHTLPEMDGVELMHRLEVIAGDIRVIVQSYDATSGAENEAAGAFASVTKPCAKSVLEAKVRAAFGRQSVECPVGA